MQKKDKILSAEEFLLDFQEKYPRLKVWTSTKEDMDMFYGSAQGAQVTIDVMIEFARLHVEAAIKAVTDFEKPILLSDIKGNTRTVTRYYANNITASLNKSQLLNAYPKENIK